MFKVSGLQTSHAAGHVLYVFLHKVSVHAHGRKPKSRGRTGNKLHVITSYLKKSVGGVLFERLKTQSFIMIFWIKTDGSFYQISILYIGEKKKD